MDSNEALRILRQAIESAGRQQDSDTSHPSFCVVRNGTVSEIIEAFEALDGWLVSGGFLPEAWKRN